MPEDPQLPVGWYDDDSGVRRYWDGAQWRTPSESPSEPSADRLRWPDVAAPTVQPERVERPIDVLLVGTVLAVIVPIAGLVVGIWARREFSGSITQGRRAAGVIRLAIGFLAAQLLILVIVAVVSGGSAVRDARAEEYQSFCSAIESNQSLFEQVVDWPHNFTSFTPEVDAYLALLPGVSDVAGQLRTGLPSDPDETIVEKLERLDDGITRVMDASANSTYIDSASGDALASAASGILGLLDSRYCV